MRLGPPNADDPRTGLTQLVSGDAPWSGIDATNGGTHYPALESDATCDVVVLGAGVTGAMCATLLVDAGMDVMLIDKRRVANGSTSANTALLLFEPDQPLHRLVDMLGEDDAATVYQLTHRALDDIARLAERLHEHERDACFSWRPSLILASSPDDVPSLHREYDARRRLGYPTTLLERDEIESRYAFSAPAALRSEHAAQMDPYRFTRGLVADSARHGLRVLEHTIVETYEPDRDDAVLTTDHGHRIRARHVVFATGYETERYTGRQLARGNATFALLTEPLEEIPGWPDRALIWETARPYTYLRTTDDDRILIGGLDELTLDAARRDAMLPDKIRCLLERLGRMFPDVAPRVAHACAGTFLTTHDSLPYIGQLPDLPHAWFALAYGGNGTTFAMMAAAMLRDAILGRPRAEMRLFRFDRPSANG